MTSIGLLTCFGHKSPQSDDTGDTIPV